MSLLFFKAVHIIGFVAWFSGMFYLVRMFVYHIESAEKPEPEKSILIKQFALMENRVFSIICTPAMYITWICGLCMIHIYGMDWFKENSWLHVKLLLLTILTIYHFWSGSMIKTLGSGSSKLSSFQLRLINEIPTLFLFSIVFLATYRNLMEAGKMFFGVLFFGILLFLGARLYKKKRDNSPKQ